MMRLTQIQIIQSLGEALSWWEREVKWGVPIGELNHLTGRIGELYTAMITRGEMADRTNQRGYDVITASGDRVSVKTITTSTHVTFNKATLSEVERIVILRLRNDSSEVSIEEVFDGTVEEALPLMRENERNWHFNTYDRKAKVRDLTHLDLLRFSTFGEYEIRQYSDTTIDVLKNGHRVEPTLPALREIGGQIGVSDLNANDNPKNTRTFGADIMAMLSTSDLGQPT